MNPSLVESTPRSRQVARLQRATLQNGTLEFGEADGLKHALTSGFFMLEIPADFDPSPGLRIAQLFNQRRGQHGDQYDMYRGFRELGDFCFDRKNYQVEQLIIGRADRARLFPPELRAMCDQMNDISVLVLRRILSEYGIPEADWETATGGGASNSGTHWFVANYYDSQQGYFGCAPHTDTGFVTVLFANREGLEIGVDGEWAPVEAVPGYFVVNFGVALERLTCRMETPARAILHRVAPTTGKQGEGARVSFAAFASAPTGGVLYEYHQGRGIVPLHDVDAFLRAHDAGTWDESRKGKSQGRSTISVRQTTVDALEQSRMEADDD